ncbi:MAG: cytochrome oxidase putative small subunit CydP [Alphaproteobacteria bacterium]
MPRTESHAPADSRRLAGELGIAVLLKLAALTLLWALFFSGGHRVTIHKNEMTEKLTGDARQEATHDR